MTDEEIQEARIRLDNQVQAYKARVARGDVADPGTLAQVRAELNGMRGIVDIGEAIKEIIPALEAQQAKVKVFCDATRFKIAELPPEMCIDHSDLELGIDEDATIGQSWKNNEFTVVRLPCKKCTEERIAVSQRAAWIEMGIPEKVTHATFANFDIKGDPSKEKVVAKFQKQCQKGSGFIIAVGTYGAGKSHLAAAALKSHSYGEFVTQHDLIGELRLTYETNQGQDALVEKYRTCKVLVLDELTKDVKGTDVAPLMYRILSYRYDKNLLTVITSNETLEECMAILGARLRDRIRENYVVCNFTWESHRVSS